jgi:hypothetical protein
MLKGNFPALDKSTLTSTAVAVKSIHSKAPKTTAAWAEEQTAPRQKRRLLMKTPRAMKPAK